MYFYNSTALTSNIFFHYFPHILCTSTSKRKELWQEVNVAGNVKFARVFRGISCSSL